MTKYPCPICNKRICDSTKELSIAKLSKSNERKADIVIKCHICKNELSVKVIKPQKNIHNVCKEPYLQ